MLLRPVQGCNSHAPFTLYPVRQRRSLSLDVSPSYQYFLTSLKNRRVSRTGWMRLVRPAS